METCFAIHTAPEEVSSRTLLEQNHDLRIPQDLYNINVTSHNGRDLSGEETLDRYSVHPGQGLPAHLYFHVPLCSYICHFCNYVKRLLPQDGNEEVTLDRWVDLLLDESNRYLGRVRWRMPGTPLKVATPA